MEKTLVKYWFEKLLLRWQLFLRADGSDGGEQIWPLKVSKFQGLMAEGKTKIPDDQTWSEANKWDSAKIVP